MVKVKVKVKNKTATYKTGEILRSNFDPDKFAIVLQDCDDLFRGIYIYLNGTVYQASPSMALKEHFDYFDGELELETIDDGDGYSMLRSDGKEIILNYYDCSVVSLGVVIEGDKRGEKFTYVKSDTKPYFGKVLLQNLYHLT